MNSSRPLPLIEQPESGWFLLVMLDEEHLIPVTDTEAEELKQLSETNRKTRAYQIVGENETHRKLLDGYFLS